MITNSSIRQLEALGIFDSKKHDSTEIVPMVNKILYDLKDDRKWANLDGADPYEHTTPLDYEKRANIEKYIWDRWTSDFVYRDIK